MAGDLSVDAEMRELGYEKPVVQLSGTDGNVFALLGKCT
jgi:hypothetical protein